MNDAEFRPVIFRALADTPVGQPGVRVFDRIDAQLRDLVKTRHPGRKLTPSEIDGLIASHLGGCARENYGVWVYYPWSGRLVHLLDEAEFTELRTNRNCYKITPAEQRALARKRIGIVGLSVGQAVALVLALERSCGELRLADFDEIDLSNLNRLRAGVHELGVPKVYVTARAIAEIDPFLNVVCFPEGLQGSNYDHFLLAGEKLDLLIEECDSIDVKIRLRQQARALRIPVLMDTSDRGMLDVERFDREPARPIFHGLVGDLDPDRLAGLTTEEKIPHVLAIIGADSVSTRLRASMIEVESSIPTWPQLASSVALGGALTADVARRVLLDQCRVSGRFYADMDELVPNHMEVTGPPDGECEPVPRRLTPEEMTSRAARVKGHSRYDVPVEAVRDMVEDAILAPSGGNCQPWLWLWDGRLHLFHDRGRSHSLLDFESAGGWVALGAAIENLALSAAHRGWEMTSELMPSEDIAGTFCFAPRVAGGSHEELYEALKLRVTNRRVEQRRPLPDGTLEEMEAAAARVEGAQLRWITHPDQLDEVGELLGEGDRIRFLDGELHRHLFSEVRFSAEEARRTGDGISIDSLELSPSDRAGVQISRSWPAMSIVRSLDGGRNLAKLSRKAVRSSPAVGLLTMPGVSSRHYLEGGRAIQRAWLAATLRGVAFHPMTALPYLLARLVRGNGQGLDRFTVGALNQVRPGYERMFGNPAEAAHVMLFRLAMAGAPTERALRLPVDASFCTSQFAEVSFP